MIEVYVDGGCSGNGQRDLSKRRMVAVVTDASGTVLFEDAFVGGSNNIAELLAVEHALAYAMTQRTGHDDVLRIYTDSRNNLAWVNGRTVGKDINDRHRVLAIKERIDHYKKSVNFELIWIPREQNKAGHVIEQRYGL